MSLLKTFLRDTVIYGLAIVLPKLINVLLVRLHTDVLPNEGYSDNTEFYIVVAFFNVILTYGLETSFFRFFNKYKAKDEVLSTALIGITVSTFIFGIILLLFKSLIAKALHINSEFYALLVAITLVDTLIVIPFAYLRVMGKPITFAIFKLINVFVFVVLNILFLSEHYGFVALQNMFDVDNKVAYIFIANLVASVVVLLLVLPQVLRIRWHFDPTIFKGLLRYGLPIMVAGLAFVINENLDKWLLPLYEGKYINGAYSASYKLAVFMTLFIQAFRMGAEPFFFNHADKENAKQTYATILKYFTIVGGFGLLVVTIYIDILTPLFISKQSYLIALDIVPIVLLANLCLGIYHNLSIWYKLTDTTFYGMYISAAGAVITIVFNVLLIPKFGFMACAYTTLVAYGFMMFLSFAMGRKKYPMPYDLKRISLYFATVAVFSFLSYYYFDRNILVGTTFLLVFLALVSWLEHKELRQLLR